MCPIGPSVAICSASGAASSNRRAIARRVGIAQRMLRSVGSRKVRNPSGVRNSISAPSFRALATSDCRLRTTPLTCGGHASVAISIRIASSPSRRQPHQRPSNADDRTLLYGAAEDDALRCKYDNGRPVLEPPHLLPFAEGGLARLIFRLLASGSSHHQPPRCIVDRTRAT